ncbi:MAG: hypothetical protein WBA88_14360 [Pseudaminobacter sp.]
MTRYPMIVGVSAALVLAALPSLANAASGQDPDWPCIQRKVPQLSLGQVWTGPELPEEAKDWAQDEDIAELVKEIAARRVPLEEAQQEIEDFAAALPPDQAAPRLLMLVQGLFDHMDAERSHVISGIARYAHRQTEIAADLRREASAVDALRTKADANPNEVAVRTERLTFSTRIFEERVQSLTFVCEVPTLIEQRLYQLTKTVAGLLPKQE